MSDDFFKEENLAASGWMKFPQIGDKIKGTFLGKFEKHEDGYGPQLVYELKADKIVIEGTDQKPGIWNVGIGLNKDFVHKRLKFVKEGEKIGFFYEKDVPAKDKKKHDAKSILVYAPGDIDPDYIDEKKIDEKKVEAEFKKDDKNPDSEPF